MRIGTFISIFLLYSLGCKNTNNKEFKQEKFDKVKWATKIDSDYPYRDKMLKDAMTNHILHGMKLNDVEGLLGPPDHMDSLYLFYPIAQQRLGFFPLHTKTLVIKLAQDSTVEWRKIHE